MKVFWDDGASEVIVYAGEELTGYLERMVEEPEGVLLRIHLRSDERAFAENVSDSYRIQIDKTKGEIVGNNDRSVLLGVYDYLHFLGCRFPMPGRQHEVVPRIARDKLIASYEKQASYFHRGVCIEGADSFENIMEYIEWLPKVGFNSFFLQFKSPYAFLKRWYDHLENPFTGEEPYTKEDAQRDLAIFEKAAKKRGILIHEAGHGWTGEVLGYQTVSWDAQTERNAFSDRMAMINGKRELFKGVPANTNLCYHNEDAIDTFASLVASYAQENPQTDYVHVWLADEFNNLCECPDCCKTTLSDQYVELLNEIDKRLTKAGLATRIVFLLYQELLWPPKKSRLKNPDRFVLMFAPISRTFEKSYEIGASDAELPLFKRNHITLPVDLRENLAFLREWQNIFPGEGFMYDYPLGRAHYGDFGYVHTAKTVHSDIRKLGEMGLNGYISCQELRAAFPNALPNYVMGHTLFEKDCHVEALIDEYYRACYGADAQKVFDYLSKLSDLDCCDYVNGIGERTDAEVTKRMERAIACCEAFEAECAGHRNEEGDYESIYWEILEYHRNYVMLFSRALLFLSKGEQEKADREWEAMREYICKNEGKFQPYLDVYRVLEVTQKYTGLHKKCELK